MDWNLRIVLPGLGRKCLDFDYLHRKTKNLKRKKKMKNDVWCLRNYFKLRALSYFPNTIRMHRISCGRTILCDSWALERCMWMDWELLSLIKSQTLNVNCVIVYIIAVQCTIWQGEKCVLVKHTPNQPPGCFLQVVALKWPFWDYAQNILHNKRMLWEFQSDACFENPLWYIITVEGSIVWFVFKACSFGNTSLYFFKDLWQEREVGYRPIALTSFLQKNYIQEDLQPCFKAHHSTEDLSQILNNLLIALDHGWISILVLPDRSAAFDNFTFHILLQRLEHHVGTKGCALSWS